MTFPTPNPDFPILSLLIFGPLVLPLPRKDTCQAPPGHAVRSRYGVPAVIPANDPVPGGSSAPSGLSRVTDPSPVDSWASSYWRPWVASILKYRAVVGVQVT